MLTDPHINSSFIAPSYLLNVYVSFLPPSFCSMDKYVKHSLRGLWHCVFVCAHTLAGIFQLTLLPPVCVIAYSL